ncbi:MAG: VCBS repeat-containing protein [Planctomycetota bacterium]
MSQSVRRFSIALVGMLSAPLAAQPLFTTTLKQHLPEAIIHGGDVAVADIDGDGDQDAFAAGSIGSRLLRNDGALRLVDVTATQFEGVVFSAGSPTFADVDGDLDPDLLFLSGAVRLYLNDGAGSFSLATTGIPQSYQILLTMAVADVDADGDVDLFVGNPLEYAYYPYVTVGGQDHLYLNDGTGQFTDATAQLPAGFEFTVAAAFADVDGDGDPDLAIGDAGAADRLWLNDGAGMFSRAPAGALPADSTGTTSDVAPVDVDGDGDLDLLLPTRLGPDRLYLNDGSGRFADASSTHLPTRAAHTTGVAVGDLDGDGDPDLALVTPEVPTQLYLNDGAGVFTDATTGRLPNEVTGAAEATSVDLDGDGDLDLLLSRNLAQNGLFSNVGSGVFVDATPQTSPPSLDRTEAVAVIDIDGDGNDDLAFGNDNGQNRLWRHRGDGTFEDATAGLPTRSDRTLAVSAGDVDRDGDADLLFGNLDAPNQLYLNDGTGQFTIAPPSRFPDVLDSTYAIVLVDLDGDGDLDFAAANADIGPEGQNRLLINDGTGVFSDATATRFPADADLSLALAAGDVDGDGDVDLIFGNNGVDRLYRNDGNGSFAVAAGALPPNPRITHVLALTDIDGDGDLDLALGNRLYTNDGSGSFTNVTAAQYPLTVVFPGAIAAGDVDGDGDQDLLAGRGALTLALNDGAGFFADGSSKVPAGLRPEALALHDLDGDRDLDLVLGQLNENRIYFNTQRQLVTPLLPILGATYQIDVFAQRAGHAAPITALPYLATATATVPVAPFGVFGLAPPVVALPALSIPAAAGIASLALTVPNAPALAGIRLHAQALVLSGVGTGNLTNVTADAITP